MIRGECPVAFALTEADGGSDVSAIKTRAVRDGDRWILSGRKMFISNAHKAKLITVSAYTDLAAGVRNGLSAFLVDTANRSEERPLGKECVSTCRSQWSPSP